MAKDKLEGKKPLGVWLKNPGGKIVLVSEDHPAVQWALNPQLTDEHWELADEPAEHPYGKGKGAGEK